MSFDLEIAARTLWMEARGEPPEGRRAVAHALVNRHLAGRWFSGATLVECCLMAAQFSCWNTNDPNRREMARLADDDALLADCRAHVEAALEGSEPDPTGGATHYHARGGREPEWARGREPSAEIGRHRFYTDVP
jgi:N-acetylmuramoyl-L-alanine amidase